MIRSKLVLTLLVALSLVAPLNRVVHAAGDPMIKKIGPSKISVGDPDFSLRVLGDNFDKDATVLLDGAPIQTQFASKKKVLGHVPLATTAATGTHTIAVRSGAGVTSNTETLTVGTRNPDVTIDRINPDALEVRTSIFAQEFQLSGEGFTDKQKVLVFGTAFDTTLRKKDQLSVIVPAPILRVPGFVPFQVKNEDGTLSNLATAPIYDKTATIASLDPASVKVGADPFTLKITGTGFETGAMVQINGIDLTPTSIKSQEIKVEVPTSIVAVAAQLVVFVVQSTGLSNAVILRVTPADNPFIYNVTPDQIQAGAGATKIDVKGANFAEKSDVLVNGAMVKTTFVGRGAITFRLTDAQTTTPGVSFAIQVKNNDGTVSNTTAISIVSASIVSTTAGKKLDGFTDGGPDDAKFRRPSRIALGPDHLLYVADQLNNAIRRLNPDTGVVETLAGDGLPGYVDTGDSTETDFTAPRFNNPLGVAVAADGTIYVADFGNNVIRRMRPGSGGFTVDTVAGESELIKKKDDRTQTNSTRRGLMGYGDAIGSKARFRGPDGLALASDGKLFVADPLNEFIRSVDTASSTFDVGTVSGLGISGFADGDRTAARYSLPVDVALTADEAILYVADLNNNRVRRIDLATGGVTTLSGDGLEGVASGPPLFAEFRGPIGVTVNPNGTVYVSDHGSNTIREITPDGVTTTLAGGGSKTNFKDGIGPIANFKDPRGVLFDPTRNVLFIADQGHERIRRIVP